MPLQPGTKLGAYDIVASIGAGGMGEVYEARDTKLDRRVAIKVLPDKLSDDPDFRDRFEREAKALAALSHPNILAVHDFGNADGLFYMVMELLEGQTLAVRLQEGPLAPRKAVDTALQLVRGLAAAHHKTIVHRDLKPGNVFITSDGQIKILDFGLAKVVAPFESDEDSETRARGTKPGAVLGTLGYMSPEQVRGHDADHRSDIFSAGAVLYEMLVGRPAFTEDSAADTVSSVLRKEPEIPESASIAPALARIITRCLEKKPADRFQSARDLVFALETMSGIETGAVTANVEERDAADSRSIAVIPFVDMSPAKDQEYFCEGVAEEILNALTGIPNLRVAARSSAFRFKGGEHDLREVGRALEVNTVLEGSVRTAGKRLRVTAQLNQVDGGYQIWSRRYDRELEDVFAIQDEIASDIVQALKLELSDAESPRVVRHTENQEAYHLYLRGRYHWYLRSKGALTKAMEYFEQAAEKDPGYALPYVGLVDVYTIQALYTFVDEETESERAKASLGRALGIDDQLAEAHRALGLIRLVFDLDMAGAASSFERSIELDPSSALSHIWLAFCMWPGREVVSLTALRKAQNLDPLNPYVISVGSLILDCWGKSDDALEECQKALDLDRNHLVGLYAFGGICSRLGRHDDAIGSFVKGVEHSGRAPFYLAYLGWALARAGRSDEARAILEELSERAAEEYVAPLHLAMIVSALGEMDRAFELLDEAVDKRNGWLALPRMPLFDAFRGDPRFDEHLKRIGHPDRPQTS